MSREELLREWIEENKDIEPEVCELVGFTLDQIKLTTAKPDDCIKLAVVKNWSGFKADWYFNENPINTVKQYSDTTAKNLKNLEGEW